MDVVLSLLRIGVRKAVSSAKALVGLVDIFGIRLILRPLRLILMSTLATKKINKVF
jgi:hypothetical protein